MIIINSQYVYLFITLIMLTPSIVFYFTHKKYRFDMFSVGLVMAVSSVVTAWLFWTKDWWFPETFFGGKIGVEDFILGFNTGSIAVIINNLFFPTKKISKNKNFKIIFSTVFIFLASMSICFFLLEINSFISFILSSIVAMLWIYAKSKFSPFAGIKFAIIYALSSIPLYFLIYFINKEWIYKTWDLSYLSGILLFNFIPIEEFIFWLLFGIIFKQIYTAWLNNEK